MVVKTNSTGALCPTCHRFGVDEDGICNWCGCSKYKVITTEKIVFEEREYWNVYLNGTYIGYGYSENDPKEFGKRYSNLCL